MLTSLTITILFLIVAAGGGWGFRRLSRRPDREGRLGVAVFTASAVSLAGFFGFITVFFWVTR